MMIHRSPWICEMFTQKLTNEQTWNSKFAKVVGKYHPDIFQFMVAQHDAAVLPPHFLFQVNDTYIYIPFL